MNYFLSFKQNAVSLTLVFACLFLSLPPLASDDTVSKPKYLPGGEEVKKAVDARMGKTELSKLAMSMEQGTWVELKSDIPKNLWAAPPPSKGLHIGTWSDDAHWDSRTGQFLYFGVRQTRKLVAYSEESNSWRAIDFVGKPNAPALLQRFGHQYSCNSFDPERSRFFTHRYCYDVVKDSWSEVPEPPDNLGTNCMTYEYFTGMDGFLSLARQPSGTLRIYSEKTKEWSSLGKIGVHGYHSLARHNPYLEEVLFAGGNDSKAVVILSKDGKTTKKRDFPGEEKKGFTIRDNILTVDPQSGRYLFITPGREFIEYDSLKDEYRLIDNFTTTPWPFKFTGEDSIIGAHIPEYGVNVWVLKTKMILYKHKLCTSEPMK